MGGVTSTRVTRPSAVTQNRTSWRRPRASRGAPGGGKIVHRGEAGKISPALPPEPAPESAPTPVPVPVPRPPPEPGPCPTPPIVPRSEEHTSELQSRPHLVCRLLLEKKKPHPYPPPLSKKKKKKNK